MNTTTSQIETFAEAEAVLASALPRYEARSQQKLFALSIEDAIESGKHLIAEAGCGTGKSLGYLIPAIVNPKVGRVIVSTATKALQDQLVGTDLPFLREHLGVDFTFAVLKGRKNYLCQAALADGPDVPNLGAIIERANTDAATLVSGVGASLTGHVGEREVFEDLLTDSKSWSALTVSSEECPGKSECPFGATCFAEIAKARAQQADVAVVNHALYFTDVVIGEKTGGVASMIGNHDLVIFDEAHEIEEYASGVLGDKFHMGTFNALSSEVRNFGRKNSGLVPGLEGMGSDIIPAATRLFAALPVDPKFKNKTIRMRAGHLISMADQFEEICELLKRIVDGLLTAKDLVADRNTAQRLVRLSAKVSSARRRLLSIFTDDFETRVRWVETETIKSGPRRVLCSTLIHVGAYLDENLWSKRQGILVSATMATDTGFDFIAGRLGIDDYDGVDVGTPFDYSEQSVLYVPTDMIDPGAQNREAWSDAVVDEIESLVMHSNGRALLLFTSRAQMNKTFDALAGVLPFECRRQGDGTTKELVDWFKAETHSVLFALKSFFTGVDIQGEALSLVVIDKLPFPTPDEPVIEARVDQIEENGGNGFKDFVVPHMSLVLKQGFGRLIRHRDDVGVVAILDSRLMTKSYGKRILRSLPPASFCDENSDVAEFFAEV